MKKIEKPDWLRENAELCKDGFGPFIAQLIDNQNELVAWHAECEEWVDELLDESKETPEKDDMPEHNPGATLLKAAIKAAKDLTKEEYIDLYDEAMADLAGAKEQPVGNWVRNKYGISQWIPGNWPHKYKGKS